MEMTAFTRNYEDNSTDAGFQFTFYCDLCHDGYKTNFVESKTYRKGTLFKSLGRGISVGASLL
ncbi:MAG: zinc ribbon domain-containing protein, partial [Clostridia bacterium]|nr:zinc ribbon domain-containing protein [Clostridia bacterium]